MEDDVCPTVDALYVHGPTNAILQPEKCTKNKCTEDDETRTIKCNNCNRKVHFECTQLPPYQLERFVSFGKFHLKYVCENCTVIPKTSKLQNYDWSEQHYKVKYEQEIEHSKETIRKLNEKVQQMESQLCAKSTKCKQKKRRIDEEHESVDTAVCLDGNKELQKEMERLREENKTLTERLQKALDKTSQQPEETNDTAIEETKNESLVERIENSFNERFAAMQANLVEIIDEKISNVNSNSSSIPINQKSYASTTAGNSETSNKQHQKIPSVQNFRSLMMSARNEELAEEKDKKERMCNIIIHGKGEDSEQIADPDFVKDMIRVIGCNVTPKSVVRIGRADASKKRPIKIILHSEQDKDKIMTNLKNLKDYTEFKGISITDDYTVSERQMIKEFANKAKEKSLLEPEGSNSVWRVRGTPKNGLVLKRYTKVKPTQAIQN